MSRVEINAGGRHIVICGTAPLGDLRATALELWQATAGPEPDDEPERAGSLGFSAGLEIHPATHDTEGQIR